MNSLQDYNFRGKRVLLRCDFNVPIKNGKVLDDFKILRALDTIRFLKTGGAKIIILSHLGRPKENQKPKIKNKKLSLKPVALKLEEVLKEKVKFLDDCIGRKVKREINKMKPGDIVLLENLRFRKGEEENDEKFAKSLAELGDVYVSEAFSVCHRNHASIVTLPKLLPHFKGLNLEKEVDILSKVSQNPEKPFVVVIGGIKIASKVGVIENLLRNCDHLLLGGYIAHIILRVKGIYIGKPWPEEKAVEKIKKLRLTSQKLHLPLDVIVSPNETGEIYVRETSLGNVRKEEEVFDIGEETIRSYREIIKEAKTIFWAGPLGYCENKKFSKGTKEIAEAIIRNYSAFKVIGGGDTVGAIKKFGLLDKFSFVSTGGGAMLAFLAGEKLPGLVALNK